MSKHTGSNFDDFLKKEAIHSEVTATAVKRVIAWQIAQAMSLKIKLQSMWLSFKLKTKLAKRGRS